MLFSYVADLETIASVYKYLEKTVVNDKQKVHLHVADLGWLVPSANPLLSPGGQLAIGIL